MGGRVLRIVTRLNRGGPLRQLEALVPALNALGWSGPVLCGGPERHEEDGAPDLAAAGATVSRLRALRRAPDPAADLRALGEILGWIRRVRPDVVHTHMAKAGALGRLAARLLRVPCVHTLHGHHFEAPGWRGPAARRAERLLGRLSAGVVVLSDRQRRDVVERFAVAGAARVRVIGPTLDVEGFLRRAADPEARRAAEGWRVPGRPLFAWAGRHVDVKDPGLLVEAVRRARADLRVVMAGNGPLRGEVEAAVVRQGIGDRVRVVGPLPHTAALTALADAVVLSSRSEGTPMAIVEAFAAGRPVVATDVGGVADLVRDGGNGLLVPPGDPAALAAALDRLASDPDLREQLARGARETASGGRFSGLRAARATADLYEAVRGTGSTIGTRCPPPVRTPPTPCTP